MNEISMLEVGKQFPDGKGHAEGTVFDIDDGGCKLIIFMDKLTLKETISFKSKEFQIKYVEIKDIIFVLFKVGGLHWMDSSYNLNLSKQLTDLPTIEYKSGKGLALQVFLVDTFSGKLIAMRLIGLGESFSRKFIETIKKNANISFDKNKYFAKIDSVFAAYGTKTLVKMATEYYKI